VKERSPMAVHLERIATMALAAALAERQPVRRDHVSGVRAVAVGVVLGTVGRVALKRVTTLGGRAIPDAPSHRRAAGVDRAEPAGDRDERLRAQAEPGLEGPSTGAIEDRAEYAGAGLASGASGPSSDDAMTRSEEELRVRTVRRESGRMRVRKYIVTEEVQRTIPVRREEICVEEEPGPEENADAGDSDGAAVSEEHDSDSYEIVLHEEVPVIEMRVVPRERVRIRKDTRREDAEVVEKVRAERIDVERDPKAD
jgi:stress response protein YsnF